MKKLAVITLFYIFYLGFFTFSKGNFFLLRHFTDKELHFLAFMAYPLAFYILLPKKSSVVFLNLFFFGFMTFGVEVLQRKFFHRSYSISDFKYSLCGFFASFVLILNFFYVLPCLLRIGRSS
jgi:hypothetical protein